MSMRRRLSCCEIFMVRPRNGVAMDACLQVLRGKAHPPAARRAFVAAALEAKILRCD
ncbi:DUF982 domain-containing protein (plasmid) [Mesorhizobium muleiense]|uniref:DUF982 domain-containing protein n=1 Tax=Mesorhizobium muleiense TaxID=1004279 RepID=UPI003AFA4179